MTPRYLSQARLDRSKPAAALVQVLDPLDDDQAIDVHHRLIWTLFADDDDRQRDFLWRMDDGQFLILSERQPEDRHGLFELRTKLFEPALSPGDRLAFRLRANAVVTRTSIENGRKRRRRHDIVMDRLRRVDDGSSGKGSGERRDRITREAAEEWLGVQGVKHGFEPIDLDTSEYTTLRLPRRGRTDASLGLLDLNGTLRVKAPDALLTALGTGFGKAKAFGCGLMLLRRV